MHTYIKQTNRLPNCTKVMAPSME